MHVEQRLLENKNNEYCKSPFHFGSNLNIDVLTLSFSSKSLKNNLVIVN